MTLFLPFNRVRNKFRKNKSTEKISSLRRTCWSIVPMEQVFFDTLYIGCEKFPQHDFYGVAVGGVRQSDNIYVCINGGVIKFVVLLRSQIINN